MAPAANSNAAAVARFDEKLDELARGQSHILERLASIEATSKAEASERATVNRYTQAAIESLGKQIEEEKQARLEDRRNDQAGRRWAIGLAASGLLFPIIVGLLFALINGIK